MEELNDTPAHEIPRKTVSVGFDNFIAQVPLSKVLDPEAFEEFVTKKENGKEI